MTVDASLPLFPLQQPVTQYPHFIQNASCCGDPSKEERDGDSLECSGIEHAKFHSRWNQGDFALQSSDRVVVFHVPAILVLYHLAPFRDVSSVTNPGERRTVSLSDPCFENASTIQLFLDFVTEGRLPNVGRDLTGVSDLCRLLMKYESKAALGKLLVDVERRLLARTVSALAVFVIGAVVDNEDLCLLTFQHDTWTTAPTDELDEKKIFVTGFTLDPSKAPYTHMSDTPTAYWWALTRSWDPTRARTGQNNVGFVEGTKFSKLLAIAKK